MNFVALVIGIRFITIDQLLNMYCTRH